MIILINLTFVKTVLAKQCLISHNPLNKLKHLFIVHSLWEIQYITCCCLPLSPFPKLKCINCCKQCHRTTKRNGLSLCVRDRWNSPFRTSWRFKKESMNNLISLCGKIVEQLLDWRRQLTNWVIWRRLIDKTNQRWRNVQRGYMSYSRLIIGKTYCCRLLRARFAELVNNIRWSARNLSNFRQRRICLSALEHNGSRDWKLSIGSCYNGERLNGTIFTLWEHLEQTMLIGSYLRVVGMDSYSTFSSKRL